MARAIVCSGPLQGSSSTCSCVVWAVLTALGCSVQVGVSITAGSYGWMPLPGSLTSLLFKRWSCWLNLPFNKIPRQSYAHCSLRSRNSCHILPVAAHFMWLLGLCVWTGFLFLFTASMGWPDAILMHPSTGYNFLLLLSEGKQVAFPWNTLRLVNMSIEILKLFSICVYSWAFLIILLPSLPPPCLPTAPTPTLHC